MIKKRQLDRNQQLAINMVSAMTNFIVHAAISFFLNKYVVEELGAEASGIVSIGNNIIQYASLVTLALNSMASRFITIKIHQNKQEEANKYFNSILISNIVIVAVLLIPAAVFIMFIDSFLNISPHLVADTQFLFIFLFINFFLTVLSSVFGSATYVRNKLYLSSVVTIITNFLRGLLLLFLYRSFTLQMYYSGMVTMLMTIITVVTNLYFSKQLLPEIKISKKYFDFNAVKEVASSGVWNTVLKLGQILMDGLDLLIANIFIYPIDPNATGVLANAKMLPTQISAAMSMISSVFAPNFNISYAKERFDILLKDIYRSIKIMGIIMNIPIAILVLFGYEFFALWMPSIDTLTLHILSILTISKLLISGSIDCLSSIFTITNKLKANSLAILVTGLLSAATTFIVLANTDLGIYAIAGISSLFSICRNLFFTIPYAAHCLKLKWYTFYKSVAKSVVCFGLMTAVGFVLKLFISINTWLYLIIACAVFSVIALFIAYFVILNKEERSIINSKIKRIIAR